MKSLCPPLGHSLATLGLAAVRPGSPDPRGGDDLLPASGGRSLAACCTGSLHAHSPPTAKHVNPVPWGLLSNLSCTVYIVMFNFHLFFLLFFLSVSLWGFFIIIILFFFFFFPPSVSFSIVFLFVFFFFFVQCCETWRIYSFSLLP